MTDLVTTTAQNLVNFTDEQVELIKRTVCKDSTNDELQLFLHVCKKSGLDPFAKQIHAVKRSTKNGPVMSIQVGIDGYRLVADRTGKYAGNDDPKFSFKKDIKGVECKQIDSATVTVYKIVAGHIRSFTATAYWDEYYPGGKMGYMWNQRPKGMLGKCAEALALRKAFPAELSGLYTNEELDKEQAQSDYADELTAPENKIDYKNQADQIEKIKGLLGVLTGDLDLQAKGEFMHKHLKISSFTELKKKKNHELDEIINNLIELDNVQREAV
jgi:phage recombination protein Bet